MARYWLDHSSDAPTTRIGRPHLIVHLDLETLEQRAGGTATLGSGAVVRGDQARQLACDANITRLITGPRSEPLDVGVTTRTIPTGIAKAVLARDRHCRFHGCHAPSWNCDIHHRQPWAQGGPTTVDNLGLVCWYHHHELHRRGPHLITENEHGRWQFKHELDERRKPIFASRGIAQARAALPRVDIDPPDTSTIALSPGSHPNKERQS